MARSHFPELDATAVALLVMLVDYEECVGRLVLHWGEVHDWSLYAQVCGAMDDVRNLCGAQPKLSLHFLELLISHVDLMHMLCRTSRAAERAALPGRYADHLNCIKSLRAVCRQLLADSH